MGSNDRHLRLLRSKSFRARMTKIEFTANQHCLSKMDRITPANLCVPLQFKLSIVLDAYSGKNPIQKKYLQGGHAAILCDELFQTSRIRKHAENHMQALQEKLCLIQKPVKHTNLCIQDVLMVFCKRISDKPYAIAIDQASNL